MVSIGIVDPILGECSLPELCRRQSFKWRTYPPDVLPAFVAEMDFQVAEPIAAAIRDALAIGDTGYPYVGELGEAYAAFAADRFGWHLDPARVFAVPDVMSGVAEVLLAATPAGSGVVINPPVYGPFSIRLGYIARPVVEAPLIRRDDGGYDLDLEALDRVLARDDVSAYLLCNPHNPIGQIWSRERLLLIADLCQRHRVTLLVDEIHSPLALPGASFVPFGSLDHDLAARAYVFTSASKGWNIAGLKCGIAVAGDHETAAVLKGRWESLLASHLGVLAAVAAFKDAVPWLDAVIAQIDRNQSVLADLLSERLPKIGYRPGEASFLAWLDCRGLGLADDPAKVFLDRGKVALSPGPDFGAQGAGFARLNIGTSPALITEAVDRIATAISSSA